MLGSMYDELSGLADIGKTDPKVVVDSISNAVKSIGESFRGVNRGSNPDSASDPITIQNVILVGVVGYLAYKFLAANVRD